MTHKQPDQQDLLDIKQAAQFLQVSETSLRRWTNSGRLASLRVGRRRERRFRRDDLVAFLEHHPVDGHGPDRRHSGAETTLVGGRVVPIGAHLLGLYESTEGRSAQAAAFLADGLRPGIVCFLIAAPESRDLILARLQQGSDAPIQTDIDAGHLVLSEYAATPEVQLAYFESALLAATRRGAKVIRLVGDVSGGPLGTNLVDIVAYESGYHRVIARRFPMVTLCQYDARRLSGLDLLAVLKCHHDAYAYPADRLLA